MSEPGPDPLELENQDRRSTLAPPPEEYANPAGVGGEVCDVVEADAEAEPCDPSEIKDMVLEESKPGYGISGYEGEEVGGG